MGRRVQVVVGVAAGVGVGWLLRQPMTPVPEVVTRWVRPAPLGMDVSDDCADPVSAACASEDQVGIALLGLPDEVPLDPPATETACRARVDLATAIATAHQLDRIGRPVPFPADLPDKYREPGFTEVARKVVATCPELGLELVRVDCTEFPCLALFAGRSANITSCPAWTEAYGEGTTGGNGTLVGPDGKPLGYAFVGPVVPNRPPDDSVMDEDGSMHWGNEMLRVRARTADAREEVTAMYGARELTPAEVRDQTRAFWREQGENGANMLEMLESQWAAEDAEHP